MRIQAKRVQKDDKLKIPHKVASSGKQQIELLLADAKAHGLKPVYCLYTSERQRNIWKKGPTPAGAEEFEYGCLLACAHKVKAKMPKTLSAIEGDCIPWHYLVERKRYCEEKVFGMLDDDTTLSFVSRVGMPSVLRARHHGALPANEFPTIDELNAAHRPSRDIEGMIEAVSPSFAGRMTEGEFLERGIGRLVEIDVRSIRPRQPPERQASD